MMDLNKPILHLNLHGCHYDQVESLIKLEEYRKLSDHWKRVFKEGFTHGFPFFIKIKGKLYDPSQVVICFSNGYARDRRQMMFECAGLKIDEGHEQWGAVPGEQYFVLSIGNKIEYEKGRQILQNAS